MECKKKGFETHIELDVAQRVERDETRAPAATRRDKAPSGVRGGPQASGLCVTV